MEGNPVFLVLTIVCGSIGALALYNGFRNMHRYRMIADTPTSRIRSIAMGIVEIVGRVRALAYMQAPFSEASCVWCKFSVEEYRTRTVKDADGKHEHTEHYWSGIDSGTRYIEFILADDTGTLSRLFYREDGQGDLIEFDPDDDTYSPSVGDRRYAEHLIEPDDQLYVLGTAKLSPSNTMVIAKGEADFVISFRQEHALLRSLRNGMIASFVFAVLFIGVASFLVLSLAEGDH